MSTKLSVNDLVVELEDLPKGTDLRHLYANPDAPLELEVGIGKGTFLVDQAEKRPDTNFFGIEWANKYHLYAADRCARRGLDNVRLLRTDARAFLQAWLADAALDALHVYFPDPWPKKRHHKRRFFNPGTVAHVLRVVRPGGHLFVATDYKEYFDVMGDLLLCRDELRELEFPVDFGQPDEVVGTNFERKYQKEGRIIYRLAFRRES